MGETAHQRLNRSITVAGGTFVWVRELGVVLGDRIVIVLLGGWIALGSAHLLENISDFAWKMFGRKLLLAARVSPVPCRP